MKTLCLWLFLTVCESLPRCLDSVSCFLFRQVPPHVSRLSFLSLSLVDCPDDVTCPWSASCLFVPRVSSASSSQLPSLYLVCFSFCVFCVSPGSYFFSTCWFFDQLFIIFCLLFHHFRSLESAAGSGSATITPPLCVCSIIRQHTRTTLCLHLFFKHLHFAFLVVWARRILLFCQNSWGYWVDKWSLYFLWIQLFISKRKNVFYLFQRVHNFTLLWELSQYLMSAENLFQLSIRNISYTVVRIYVWPTPPSVQPDGLFPVWFRSLDSTCRLTWAHLSSLPLLMPTCWKPQSACVFVQTAVTRSRELRVTAETGSCFLNTLR